MNKLGYILYIMKPKNTSSNAFCFEDLCYLVFVECGDNI